MVEVLSRSVLSNATHGLSYREWKQQLQNADIKRLFLKCLSLKWFGNSQNSWHTWRWTIAWICVAAIYRVTLPCVQPDCVTKRDCNRSLLVSNFHTVEWAPGRNAKDPTVSRYRCIVAPRNLDDTWESTPTCPSQDLFHTHKIAVLYRYKKVWKSLKHKSQSKFQMLDFLRAIIEASVNFRNYLHP